MSHQSSLFKLHLVILLLAHEGRPRTFFGEVHAIIGASVSQSVIFIKVNRLAQKI